MGMASLSGSLPGSAVSGCWPSTAVTDLHRKDMWWPRGPGAAEERRETGQKGLRGCGSATEGYSARRIMTQRGGGGISGPGQPGQPTHPLTHIKSK